MAKRERKATFYETAAQEARASTVGDLRQRLASLSREELLVHLDALLVGMDDEARLRFARRLPPLHPQWREGRLPYASDEEFLAEARDFYERVANEEFVDYVEFDPKERQHRGFGDDSWIEQMDALFDLAEGYFAAGHYDTAAQAYKTLFDCLRLQGDGGWFFTTTSPAGALRTDTIHAKARYFAALWQLAPGEATVERILDEIWVYHYFEDDGAFDLARLFPEGGEVIRSLETALLRRGVRRHDRPLPEALDPTPDLLRQIYTHFRTIEEMARFAEEHGPEQPWVYQELARAYAEKGDWQETFRWAGEALGRDGGRRADRAAVADYRARAARELGERSAAVRALWEAFEEQPNEARYQCLRDEAQAQGKWQQYYTRAIHRLTPVGEAGASSDRGELNRLAIEALLTEGDLEEALALALRRRFASAWDGDDDPRLLMAGYLLRSVTRGKGPEAIAGHAPEIARRLGQLPEFLQRLPAGTFSGDLPDQERDQQIDWIAQLLLARIAQTAEEGNAYEAAAHDALLLQQLYRLQGRPDLARELPAELHTRYWRKQHFRSALRKAGLEPPEKPRKPAR